MGAFHYTAMDARGKEQKGVMEADTMRQVRQQLRERKLLPVHVACVGESKQKKSSTRTGKSFLKKRVSLADLCLLTRQMATLISAGIPLDEVLSGVANQTEKPQVKSVLFGVRAKVLEGHSLAAGMREYPGAFPKLYCTTVASGEKSGKLDVVLNRLAEYTEKQQQIKRKIHQALIYPSLMTVVSINVVVFLLIYVVPKIIGVFHQTNQSLPMMTLVLLAFSTGIKKYGLYVLGALVLALVWYIRQLKKVSWRRAFHRFMLKLPIIGKNVKTINSARFARTFGILSAAGVPVLEAMQAASQLITPLPMREAVQTATNQVREGANIHLALQQTRFFSPMFIHLVASGESSGQLEQMLQKAAANQESDVEALIEGTLTLFEPLMILVMGGVVLFIVLAVMLPIFTLDNFGA